MYFETKEKSGLIQVVQCETLSNKINRYFNFVTLQPVPGWVISVVFSYIVIFCLFFILFQL